MEAEILAWINDSDMTPRREPWRITSLRAADWAMRTVAEVRARQQEFVEEARRWNWSAERVGLAAVFLEEALREWGIGQRTPKLKTVQLAHGTVATREAPARIEVVDEEEVIEWAAKHAPEALHTTTKFLKSEVPGDAWRIAEVVIQYEAIDRATGEVETMTVESLGLRPAPYSDEAFADLQAKMPDYSLTPEVMDMVLDADDVLVPGVRVEPGHVTATVKPTAAW